MPVITKKIETARGCGYRKRGGIYLVSSGFGAPCAKLPFALTVCPCCGAGIKFTRGFTWISSAALFGSQSCPIQEGFFQTVHTHCPLSGNLEGKMGLLWVGEKFYKSAILFEQEASVMGISRRIATVPHDFVLGKTWIALAHIKAIVGVGQGSTYPELSPGIFRVFKPQGIEYVVTGQETEDELIALEKRGFTLIDVIRDRDMQSEIFNS